MERSRALGLRRLIHTGGLLVFGLWTALPFYWIVVTSIKPNLLVSREPSLVPSQLTLEHFAFVLGQTPFLLYVKNSVTITIVTTALSMIIGTLAAYSIARLS